MVPQTIEHIGELAFAGIGGSGEWQKMMDNIANMYGGIFEVVDTAGEPIEGGLYDSYLISAQNEAVKKYCEDPEMESWGMNIHHTSSITDSEVLTAYRGGSFL